MFVPSCTSPMVCLIAYLKPIDGAHLNREFLLGLENGRLDADTDWADKVSAQSRCLFI
jgi:hypothetical protein